MARVLRCLLVALSLGLLASPCRANPWNGKVVLQAFWWDCRNDRYEPSGRDDGGWYTYLAKLAPRLREMGFDGIWVPVPCKGKSGSGGMGYDLFDHYDIGQKHQKGTTGTRFGDQDAFLRMIAVAHANGLEVYPDIVLNHMTGGDEDPNAQGDKFKSFQYRGFAGEKRGRWVKGWLDFHPNPHHSPGDDEWRKQMFGPDICYRSPCCDHECANGGTYMRDNARSWFVWLKKQTDVDGFRFDAVKHFPPEVVEDLLFNAMDAGKPESEQRQYFAVGEFVVNDQEQHRIDDWASRTKNRCGTFDFAYREALVKMVEAKGFFDMGSLPNFQQGNRLKTVPFINNHDTWRGFHSDSSGNGKSDHSDSLKNGDELVVTLDPDRDWADVAYAAMMAVDGSPQVYYEDLFKNNEGDSRFDADPATHPVRPYVANLVWCHQKLNFKDGAYKVRFRESQDLLVIERSGKAVIALNDRGDDEQSATIQTDFGASVELHDYSGSTANNLRTDADGKLRLTVPPKSYCVWGPTGMDGGFTGHPRRTTQEFQMDDDLGDSHSESLRYGGKLNHSEFRTAGSVWLAKNELVRIWVYTDAPRNIELQVLKPNGDGRKATDQGTVEKQGLATASSPVNLDFHADREGYHQLIGKLVNGGDAPVRAYFKIEYSAPATSTKF